MHALMEVFVREIAPDEFEAMLSVDLGEHWPRAKAAYDRYGLRFSYSLLVVLLHASDVNKVEAVLKQLEDYYAEDVTRPLNVGDTHQHFRRIRENVLEISA